MATNTKDRLTITEDHIKLLGRSFYEWSDDAYDGAVWQDIKRPYGNSYVVGDLYEILRSPDGRTPWDEDEDGEMPDSLHDELVAIHRQMADVVQILVLSIGHGFPFEVGRTYAPTRDYDRLSWRPVTPEQAAVDEHLAAAQADADRLNERFAR